MAQKEGIGSRPINAPSPVPASGNRIYILGIGNIGKLFAHSLATQNNPPPITLLLHRSGLLEAWEEAGRTIDFVTGDVQFRNGTFDVELIQVATVDHSTAAANIDNLIVATKAANTAEAISSIKNRLTESSTILFTQNGIGTLEEVGSRVFLDKARRPKFLACITSHGVYSQGPFSSVHAGFGNIAIGDVSSQIYHSNDSHDHHSGQDSTYLVKEIVRAPLLAAREVSPVELTRLQLEKLVINAMINPLTVIFNSRNGELFTNSNIARLMRLILAEASHIICSLPELQGDRSIQDRFSVARLDTVVLDVAEKTGPNISSMLQDIRAGRQTEIDYINGYLVRRGVEVGVECQNNEKLIQLVKERRVIKECEIELHFPDLA